MDYQISTLSVCEHCYRHVHATKFEKNGSIWLEKTCPTHGTVTHLIEPDGQFYLDYKYHRHALQSYFVEVTNKCNLACPHCYQMPDNLSTDPTITFLLEKIKSWPDDGYPVALVGAEPTTRKDLPNIIRSIQSLPGKTRGVMILTNGVNMSNRSYVENFVGIPDLTWTFGLNHPDYQGHKVREKQIEGIKNCTELGLVIKNISYTLEDMSQLEYCLKEIQEFGTSICQQYRVRCGADIGRTPSGPQIYLSDLVKETKKLCEKYNWSYEEDMHGNRAHYSVKINGLPLKIIQWPDATTLDLSETQTEAIADILPGQPPSPLVHQVILRDGAINKKLPLLDTIPKEWIDNYGK